MVIKNLESPSRAAAPAHGQPPRPGEVLVGWQDDPFVPHGES